MPKVTFSVSAERMPPAALRNKLTQQCTTLLESTLHAALDNIHIAYVAVQAGRGHAISVEILYRDEPFRTATVMDTFLEQLDDVITSTTGQTARIRCFAFPADAIHARN